jgi:hypothetical protein
MCLCWCNGFGCSITHVLFWLFMLKKLKMVGAPKNKRVKLQVVRAAIPPHSTKEKNCWNFFLVGHSWSGTIPHCWHFLLSWLPWVCYDASLFRASPCDCCYCSIAICFDLTDMVSFQNVKKWLQEIDRYACENVNKVIAGTTSSQYQNVFQNRTHKNSILRKFQERRVTYRLHERFHSKKQR